MTQVVLKPYGELADGSFGYAIDANDRTLAAIIEVLDTLPAATDIDNFQGRTVFSKVDKNLFSFDSVGNSWIALKTGQVAVGTAAPTAASPQGSLYYATSTEILYIYVGGWIGIAGKRGSGVVWRHYSGDGLTSLYPTGSSQMPPVEYVQVFVNGQALQPGANGVRDYYMVGNDVQLATTPSTNAKVSVRTMVFVTQARNSNFLVRQYDTNGSLNSFDTGTQMVQPGQALVTLDGVVQRCDYGAGNGTYDYKILTQNNTVTTLSASSTTATAVTASNHGLSVGSSITIVGAAQAQYNGTWTVTTVVSPTSVRFTLGTAPTVTPATGSIRFGPLTQNDRIAFYSATGALEPIESGMKVYIQTVENILATI